MKKSKVIVPALGLLILSTAASVSGTVAWFTAVRNFSATIGNFAVVKTTADLSCQFTGLIGTTASTETTLAVDANTVLTDGSFDYTSSMVAYPLSASGNRFAQTNALGFETKTADEAVTGISRGTTSDGKKIFSVFSWKMTFSYTSQTSGSTGLFINFDENETAATATVNKPTKAGFRVAFVNVSGGKTLVWAPFRGNDDDLVYVSGINNTTKNVETSSLVAGSNTGYNCITEDKTDLQSLSDLDDGATASTVNTKANYIGTFVGGTTDAVTSIVYNCVAWYEGTDSAVVSSNDLATISLKLSFDARTLK